MAALRARVAERYGSDFVDRVRGQLEARLAALDPDGDRPAPPAGGEEQLRPPAYTFAERFRDTSQALAALDVLATARPLRPDAVVSAPAMPIGLGEGEARAVTGLADALEETLVRLLETERPDWGFTMLLGMGETKSVSFTSTLPEGELGPLAVRYSPTVTKTPVTIADSCDSLFPPAEPSLLESLPIPATTATPTPTPTP